MAFVDIAIGAADLFGPEMFSSFLGEDFMAGTVLDGMGAEFAGGALGDYAGGMGADYMGSTIADYAGGGGADAISGGYGSSMGEGSFDMSNISSGPYSPPTNATPPGYSAPFDGSSYMSYAKTGLSALSSLAGGAAGAAYGPALGTLGAGLIGANGASQAAQTQANAATQTIAMQQGMFDKSQANLKPFMDGGTQAMGQLNAKLADGSLGGTFTGADYLANKDPGYEFQLNQGTQALQNSQAAKDGVLGGSSLKGLIDYNQGVASTGYQSAYNRWLASQQNTYNQLSGTAAIGANAAAGGASNAGKFAGTIGDNMTGRGNSLAAGQVGVANNYAKSVGGVSNQLYALSDMAGRAYSGGSSYDQGFNGQNNPANQAQLDNFINNQGF